MIYIVFIECDQFAGTLMSIYGENAATVLCFHRHREACPLSSDLTVSHKAYNLSAFQMEKKKFWCSLARLTNAPDLLALHIKERQKQLQALQPSPLLYVSHQNSHDSFKKCSNLMLPKCILKKDKVEVRSSEFQAIVKTAPEAKSVTSLSPPKNGSLSEFLLMSIHFSQSNGLWRSDWFYTELNNPKPVQLKSWSSAVRMLTPLNHLKCLHDSIFFTVDDNWIEFPQSGCPFPVCVWRVAMVAGEFRPTLPFT